jgi:hypothetical protein
MDIDRRKKEEGRREGSRERRKGFIFKRNIDRKKLKTREKLLGSRTRSEQKMNHLLPVL